MARRKGIYLHSRGRMLSRSLQARAALCRRRIMEHDVPSGLIVRGFAWFVRLPAVCPSELI